MKKIFGAVVAMGIAGSAQAQEQKDSILFWDTTNYGVILDYFAGELDQYKGKYPGNLMAVFGLRVNGAYDNLRWSMEHCSALINDQGNGVKAKLHKQFSDTERLSDYRWLSKLDEKSIDRQSIRQSIDKAVDQAVDHCTPKIS